MSQTKRSRQTKGVCSYCGASFTTANMTKHLATCSARQAAIAAADQGKGEPEALYHLRVRDKYRHQFWLNLEVRGSSTLEKLDDYLRAIWLECCDHLSQFSTGEWIGHKIAMTRTIGEVIAPGVELTHVYDFGTSSYTLIMWAGVREGKPTTRHPIALMARNLLPESTCIECDQPAAYLCLQCLIDDDVWGTLCEDHVETHPHHEYGEPIPLVNSPRLGLCGYDGPAEPPY